MHDLNISAVLAYTVAGPNLVLRAAGMVPKWALTWTTGNVGEGAHFMAKWP